LRSASPSTEFFKPPPQRRSDIFTALQPLVFSSAILLPWLAHSVILGGGRIPEAPLIDTRGFAWLKVWVDHAIRTMLAFKSLSRSP